MNRSLFSVSPFRPSYGLQPVGRLGQDFLEDLGLDDIDELTGQLDDVIAQLPVGTAGPFAKRRDECVAKSNVLEKYKCLYDLFQDVKGALRGEEEKQPPVQPPAPRPAAKEGGFPIVPVAIGGIVVIGVAYMIIRGGK